MKVNTVEFLKRAMLPEQCPKGNRPEFAFSGRSNVGKSSLLNRVLGRKGIAKTSATPGKTQTINFFDVNERIYFVDLPGYGYAKVPAEVKRQWNIILHQYLTEREQLKLVVQLIDSRHPPTPKDLEMISLLDEAEVPTLIVATKLDKLTRSERDKNLREIRKVLELESEALVIPFSAVTGEGVGPIWDVIDELCKK